MWTLYQWKEKEQLTKIKSQSSIIRQSYKASQITTVLQQAQPLSLQNWVTIPNACSLRCTTMLWMGLVEFVCFFVGDFEWNLFKQQLYLFGKKTYGFKFTSQFNQLQSRGCLKPSNNYNHKCTQVNWTSLCYYLCNTTASFLEMLIHNWLLTWDCQSLKYVWLKQKVVIHSLSWWSSLTLMLQWKPRVRIHVPQKKASLQLSVPPAGDTSESVIEGLKAHVQPRSTLKHCKLRFPITLMEDSWFDETPFLRIYAWYIAAAFKVQWKSWNLDTSV